MNARAAPAAALDPLVRLGHWLKDRGYRFTSVTPATHARVNARAPNAQARDLRDVFGWSRPFAAGVLRDEALRLLADADLLEPAGDGLWRCRVRASTLEGELFFHSAFPTTQDDAVFFGPDTTRFWRLVRDELQRRPLATGARVLDVGCGSGAGGILAASHTQGESPRLVLTDINPRALELARVNACLASIEDVDFACGDLYRPVRGDFDLVIANPPYLNDRARRAYRHGGGTWGEALGVRIVREGLHRLQPGGRLVLYTGCAMLGDEDPLWTALEMHVRDCGWPWRYEELDPDVFGEELDEPAYGEADRIAVVSLVVERPLA